MTTKLIDWNTITKDEIEDRIKKGSMLVKSKSIINNDDIINRMLYLENKQVDNVTEQIGKLKGKEFTGSLSIDDIVLTYDNIKNYFKRTTQQIEIKPEEKLIDWSNMSENELKKLIYLGAALTSENIKSKKDIQNYILNLVNIKTDGGYRKLSDTDIINKTTSLIKSSKKENLINITTEELVDIFSNILHDKDNYEASQVNKIKLEKENSEEYKKIHTAAIKELKTKNPMEKFIAAYKQSHIGHYQILKAIVYAECLKSSCTTKGLQPAVNGKKGSGKSHAVRTSVHLLPRESLYRGTLSPMSLYHMKPKPKTTFYIDDAVLDTQLIATMKRKQTEFHENTDYYTLVDREWKTITIPKRMVFILTSVIAAGDDQLSDRSLLIEIKNEKSDDEEFYKFENLRRMEGRPEFEETEDVSICREMLSHIDSKEFKVVVPSIDFAYYHDRRLMGQIYDLMEGSAILNYMNRKNDEHLGKDIITVYATKEDLKNAIDFDMFKFSNKNAAERLTKTDIAIDEKIQNLFTGDVCKFTEKELAEKLNVTLPTMRYYLYGKTKDGKSLTAAAVEEGKGLCGKCPWYKPDIEKNTEVSKIYITVMKTNNSIIHNTFAFLKGEIEEYYIEN